MVFLRCSLFGYFGINLKIVQKEKRSVCYDNKQKHHVAPCTNAHQGNGDCKPNNIEDCENIFAENLQITV